MGCASSAEKVVVLDDLAAVRTASGRAPCGKFLSADDYKSRFGVLDIASGLFT